MAQSVISTLSIRKGIKEDDFFHKARSHEHPVELSISFTLGIACGVLVTNDPTGMVHVDKFLGFGFNS